MKSKKAFLLGEYTLKIIIGVLCLLLLVYLLYSLYSNFQSARDLKMAEATLDELTGKMDEARVKGQEQTITLLNPADWYIYIFKQDFKYKPVGCESSCVCICNSYATWFGGNVEDCNKQGVCKDFDGEIDFLGSSYISVFGDFNIKYETNKFIITKNE